MQGMSLSSQNVHNVGFSPLCTVFLEVPEKKCSNFDAQSLHWCKRMYSDSELPEITFGSWESGK